MSGKEVKQLCGVCNDHIPKYRCPACRIRYCSLGCFRKHKNDDSCQPVQGTVAPATACATALLDVCESSAEQPWTVDDLLDEDSQSDRVSLQRLQQLGESETLKGLLQNPHLRQLMMEVDSAEDKTKVMQEAMQEPLFVELADQCLQIIEPTEKDQDEL